MTERIRTTISLTPEAHEIFKRIAAASNTSVSRAMGDWLTDTADAAAMIASKMEEAKAAPARVLRELQAMVTGMAAEVDSIAESARAVDKAQRQARHAQRAASVDVPIPPSSNTGVLVPPVPPSPVPKSSKSVGKRA
jgi:hypothetical protein